MWYMALKRKRAVAGLSCSSVCPTISHANLSSFGGDSTLTVSYFAEWVLAAVRKLCPPQDFPLRHTNSHWKAQMKHWLVSGLLVPTKVTKVENEKLT